MSDNRCYVTNLASLLKNICAVPAALNTQIYGLQMDSRKVQKGDLFLALPGARSSPAEHIVEAIRRGANAVVAEAELAGVQVVENGAAVQLFVDNLKQSVGVIADRFFLAPSQSMSVIGITGTNGKTSVSHYLANYLHADGVPTGIIGTLGYGIPALDNEAIKLTDYTTPNVVDVHRYLAQLRDRGVQCVTMEVSSHGLDQGRVDAVRFEGAVFTNLTRDHLDYHGTMQNYALAKSKLFKSPGLKFAVLNNDDPYAAEMKSVLNQDVMLVTYGIDHAADVKAEEVKFGLGIQAQVATPVGRFKIDSRLLGRFNLSNLLAVVGVAVAKSRALSSFKLINQLAPVTGRMEMLHVPGRPTVVVDYAHTPDALKNVLEALKPHCQGRLRVVFGCGGDRDSGKRPQMAAIAEALADDVLVTDDNVRFEDPEQITNDILKGFTTLGRVEVIHDRKLAIASSLAAAHENDLIVVVGKGHETWQEVRGQRSHFSDIEEVRRILGVVVSGKSRQDAKGVACD